MSNAKDSNKRNIYEDKKLMKLVVMVALMSTKQCCLNTVKHENHQLLEVIWEEVLKPMLDA
jgi:hypothetical protein